MEFARVLDQDHPVAALSDLGEERIDQRGLARAGAAHDDDVLLCFDSLPQRLRLQWRHDLGVDIVGEPVEHSRGLADREARTWRHRG